MVNMPEDIRVNMPADLTPNIAANIKPQRVGGWWIYVAVAIPLLWSCGLQRWLCWERCRKKDKRVLAGRLQGGIEAGGAISGIRIYHTQKINRFGHEIRY